MREIKFRAWDSAKSRMWQGFDLHEDGFDYPPSVVEPPRRKLIFMQYTGLKDKNGVEVYQGDILQITRDKAGYGHTSYGGFAEVTAETCGYALRCFGPTFKELDEYNTFDDDGDLVVWDSSSLWHVDDDDGENIEVIGNIHEQPELLEAAP